MEVLSAYGIPKKIADAINILQKNNVAQVITPDGETDLFEVIGGVLQEYTLSPFSPLLRQIMHFGKLPGIHQSVLCQRKDKVLGNMQYSSLMQILQMILPCFQTIWNKPSFFCRDWELQPKPFGCTSTARKGNI